MVLLLFLSKFFSLALKSVRTLLLLMVRSVASLLFLVNLEGARVYSFSVKGLTLLFVFAFFFFLQSITDNTIMTITRTPSSPAMAPTIPELLPSPEEEDSFEELLLLAGGLVPLLLSPGGGTGSGVGSTTTGG